MWIRMTLVVAMFLCLMISDTHAYKHWCAVELRAFGNSDSDVKESWIKVNGEYAIKPSDAKVGFNTIELDPSTCKTSNLHNWNTINGKVADLSCDTFQMGKYIDALPSSTVVLGVTAQDWWQASYGICGNIDNNYRVQFGFTYRGRWGDNAKLLFVSQKARKTDPAYTIKVAGGSNAHAHVNVFQKGWLDIQ